MSAPVGLDRHARRAVARRGRRPGRRVSPVPTPPPQSYRCTGCGAEGVKLWRPCQTFAAFALLCAPCASKDQKEPDTVGPDGERPDKTFGEQTDQIGWLIPAVPCDDTFWGYTSVPREGCAWWKALPTRGSAAAPAALGVAS